MSRGVPTGFASGFRVEGRGNELRDAGEEDYRPVEPAAWTQGFKDQLAISIAKVVLAREAAQGSK